MTKYYRDFKSSSLRKLQAAIAGASGVGPVTPASPATITISAADANGTGVSQITGKVDHLFTTTDKYSVYNKANWFDYFTVPAGTHYWAPPQSGTDRGAPAVLAFRYEGSKFELMARSGDIWSIFADGVPVSTGNILLTYAAGNATRRLTVDFGARGTRNIVCYGNSFGFAGISVGPTDTIAPIDLPPQVKLAFMTDSYGQSPSAWSFIGPFGAAAMRLLGPSNFPLISTSVGAGSGYLQGGTGGAVALVRVPNIVQQSPDLVLLALGINDGTTGLLTAAASTMSAIRTALPNAVIANVGVWTPSNSYLTSSQTKRDLIYGALQGISGPWVDIDVTRGVWANSATGTGRIGPAPWVTGTGKVGTPSGTGNADFNTSSDGVHPQSPEGHEYLGAHLWEGLRAGILDL